MLSQRNKNKSSYYYKWQQETEKRAIKKILSFKKYKFSKITFDIQDTTNLKFVNKEAYVITKKKNDLLSKDALDIFSIIVSLNTNCLVLYSDEDCINENGKGIVQNSRLPGIGIILDRSFIWKLLDYKKRTME